MERVIGLDFGAKTVGVAVCDELRFTASPVGVIRRDNENDVKKTIEQIIEYAEKYNAAALVLGLPKNMDGSLGSRAEKTLEFKRRLEKALKNTKITVELFDERLTSKASEAILREAGISSKEQKKFTDKMAAAQILDGYLRSLENKKFKETKMSENNVNTDELEFDGEDDLEIITMTDEEGNEAEFVIIDEIEDKGATYILVADAEALEDDESDAAIFKEVGTDDEDFVYEEIEDDAEFERIAKLFGERGGEEYDLDI